MHNKAIAQIIENSRKYYIHNSSGDSLKLRSRVEPAPAETTIRMRQSVVYTVMIIMNYSRVLNRICAWLALR